MDTEAADRFEAANYGELADPKAHTPGPWKLIPHPDNSDIKSDYDVVDENSKWHVGVAFGEPDARLIAKAPELADVLRQIVHQAQQENEQPDAQWDETLADYVIRTAGSLLATLKGS